MSFEPEQITCVQFSTSWRGYNRDEVTAFVNRIASYYRAAVAELARRPRSMATEANIEIVRAATAAIDAVAKKHEEEVALLRSAITALEADLLAARATTCDHAVADVHQLRVLDRASHPAGNDIDISATREPIGTPANGSVLAGRRSAANGHGPLSLA